ncbi:MAG: hypothetical protein ACXQTM_08215 [Methanosarcinales archaeon]
MYRSNHETEVNDALFVAENAVIVGDVVLEKGVNVWYGACYPWRSEQYSDRTGE